MQRPWFVFFTVSLLAPVDRAVMPGGGRSQDPPDRHDRPGSLLAVNTAQVSPAGGPNKRLRPKDGL